MPDSFKVEVAFATPSQQELVEIEVVAGATVQDAIDQSRIAERFEGFDIASMPVGIWGREAGRKDELRSGDRVEIYRALEVEPRDARRQLAEG
jgi:putative ubiquitin-RnfH superfamily antitoxin RatB of RatAB toxin-antitoxin module